jgi:hypothetical protein
MGKSCVDMEVLQERSEARCFLSVRTFEVMGCFHCSSGFLHESGLVTVDYCLLFWYETTFVAFIALLPNF